MRRRPAARGRRPHLLVRVHVLPGMRRRDERRLPELRRRARPAAAPRPGRMTASTASTGARHLYVHLPFCASRCGYCDFVTVVGHPVDHSRYVGALLREQELERRLLAPQIETLYLGGGTPTLTDAAALERLLTALPAAAEVTVEANPETVTSELAELLRRNSVNRVS